MTSDDLLQALRDCYDPTLPCNIVDLGLVEDLQLTPDADAPGATIPGIPAKYRAAISLISTTQDDTATAQLRAQVANRLAGIESISSSTVTLLSVPVWDPRRINAAGRRRLGLDGNPSLIQITALKL